MKKEKKLLIVSAAILGILIITPVLIYLWNFSGQKLSSDPSNWGTLGDFIGGIINPIIALASLIILSYLTYLVSQQSNEKNKSLLLFEKKLSAYEELTKPFKEINLVPNRITITLQGMEQLEDLTPEIKLQKLIEIKRQFSDVTNVFTDYYYTLRSCNLNHGHLFEYDFSCSDFSQLLEQINELGKYYNSVATNLFNKDKVELSPDKFKPSPKTMDLLAKVFNEIRNEVLPKNH